MGDLLQSDQYELHKQEIVLDQDIKVQEHLDTLMEASRLLEDDSNYEALEPKLQKVYDFLTQAVTFTGEQTELLMD